MDRIEHVPTLVVTGERPGDAPAAIARLLEARPEGATWGVLTSGEADTIACMPGVAVASVHGCPCCTGQVALRVALTRLLREARPARLFVALDAGPHADNALAALRSPWLASALAIEAVIDASRLDVGALLEALRQPARAS